MAGIQHLECLLVFGPTSSLELARNPGRLTFVQIVLRIQRIPGVRSFRFPSQARPTLRATQTPDRVTPSQRTVLV
jgi:hypothetical protein